MSHAILDAEKEKIVGMSDQEIFNYFCAAFTTNNVVLAQALIIPIISTNMVEKRGKLRRLLPQEVTNDHIDIVLQYLQGRELCLLQFFSAKDEEFPEDVREAMVLVTNALHTLCRTPLEVTYSWQ